MPGLATNFLILDRTIAALDAAGMMAVADVMRNNPWAYFGAVGPSIGDFLPSDPPADPTMQTPPPSYSFIWVRVFGVVGGDPGLIATLGKFRDILDKVQAIADAEDCDALKALRDSGELDSVQQTANDFASLIGAIQSEAQAIVQLITSGSQNNMRTGIEPVFCELTPKDAVPAPSTWPARDLLHWRKTGAFVQALLKKADASGDARLQAYAYGYLVSYAANACGNSFVNSIVGGPPRTQWWRQRFIRNWVDAWTFGFYGSAATISGDTPSPAYDDWPSLCSAALHAKMQIGTIDPAATADLVKRAKPFPVAIPPDFAALWFQAFSDTYGVDATQGVTADSLNGAYVMTWLMLWMQTTGGVLPCQPTMPMQPPDGCGTDPTELDPFQPSSGGGPTPPPATAPETHDNEVCGIILAILGVLGLLTGNIVAGAAALAEAGHLLSCSAAVEWADFRCKLFNLNMYLLNGLQGMHRLLTYAGFVYPESDQLGADENALQLLGIQVGYESSINLVKSRQTREDFPSKCWDGDLLTYGNRPTAASPGFETPRTTAYRTETYPSFFVDDVSNPLGNGDVKTPGGFPDRVIGGLPVQFGNAVENAVDLFRHIDKPFPDWNLDADRGLTYAVWQFHGGYDPNNVQIEPVS